MTDFNTERNHYKFISWCGGLFANNSLAHVNRELCLQLLEEVYRISFIPTEPDDFPPSVDPRFKRLEAIRNLAVERPDITIRHQWPPDFTPVISGKLVLIQPWEFGSLPKEWITPFSTVVDEVWVPTNYVRECYISSGVPAERVQVVPNGVDTGIFTPSASKFLLKTTKQFRFLFVGGTIQRKGIDLLLGAYHNSFTADDDVCLVIKDMGSSSVYEGQTAGEMIERFISTAGAPEIEYIDRTLSPAEMAGLYTACNCLVHPYRGEGFGLPIAEAMACGLPAIVTGYGAALDFCNESNAWLIPATIQKLPNTSIGSRETVDYPWLAEPDFASLCNLMRHAATHPDEVSNRGTVACRTICEQFTWKIAAQKATERLTALTSRQTTAKESKQDNPVEKNVTTQDQLTITACNAARIQSQRGDIDGAVQTLLNQGIKIAPDSPAPYLELAEILVTAGRHEDALQVLPEMPVSTDPTLKFEIEAICHAAHGDDHAANLAAQNASGRPRALVVLGTLAARRGDLQQAEALFRQAIAADPSCGSGWLSLGMLFWSLGKSDDAWQAVKRSVTVDPLNDEAVRIMRDMAERFG
jgi:glycosyltransferase involved in cell wall biosynthesis